MLVAFVVLGLVLNWFVSDDAGKTVHPAGAIFSFKVPQHFVKGGFGGGDDSSYRGPREGPDFTYISMTEDGGSTNGLELVLFEVVHHQSDDSGQELLEGVRKSARRDDNTDEQGRFRLLRVARHDAVQWTDQTRSVGGEKLGRRKIYIQYGNDALVVTCQWLRRKHDQARIEQGCSEVLKTMVLKGRRDRL